MIFVLYRTRGGASFKDLNDNVKPHPNAFEFILPQWLLDALPKEDAVFATAPRRMEFVISLARRNIEERTGGPFAAAIFEAETGRFVSAGLNLVLHSRWSGAHAEVVAMAMAQRRLESHDLSAPHLPRMELVTSVEPCAMCLGAIPWSGVVSVVSGASDADARAVGFDEGPKVKSWAKALRDRGISVSEGVMAEHAREILKEYEASGGIIYNSRRET